MCSEPDQKPEFLIGNVPCPCTHCVRGQRSSSPAPTFPLPLATEDNGCGPTILPRPVAKRQRTTAKVRPYHPPFLARSAGEEGGARGEGEGRQARSAAPTLTPVYPCSIHQDAGQRPALPARNHCVRGQRSSSPAPTFPLPLATGDEGEGQKTL